MKRFLAWSVPTALVLALLPAVWWGRLPDPMASHWNAAGEPDGSLPRAVMLALPFAVWLVGAAAARHHPPIAAGTGVLAVVLQGMGVWANLDRADWQDARSLAWWTAALALVLPLLAGWLALRLSPRRDGLPAGPVETLDLPPGEHAVWVSRCTNPLLLALSSLSLVVGAAMLLTGGPGGAAAPVLLVIGVAGALVGTVRVQVSERGVAVAYGPWSFPVWRKALQAIAAARTEDLKPMQVGGWGLRGLPPRTTLMLRGGECLVLEYPGGGRFAISVDDAARGAALINTLKNR
ncbi:DUF1648 domain-containing protein [Actinocorallia populi]|uniref:DUF1648 domain-containing protein n=1 Tax=Actinocorallia populi TaxID=2079200 RepID=UPI000D0874E6|nr:DUF1648 domain-containing protein [Actinocorallia populi]